MHSVNLEHNGRIFSRTSWRVRVLFAAAVTAVLAGGCIFDDGGGGETRRSGGSYLGSVIVENIPFNVIEGGTAPMGDIQGYGKYENETPVHHVTLSSFMMSAFEITQGQFEAIMGYNPSYFTEDPDYPVEQVTWEEAAMYCNRLSDAAGLDRCYDEETWGCDFDADGFRLPTEAEWEFACRARTTSMYYSGNSEEALDLAGWYRYNSHSRTNPAGSKLPNNWDFYDMHGNVWEWCTDWYERDYYSHSEIVDPAGAPSGAYRSIRGGSWYTVAGLCRSAARYGYPPTYSYHDLGFRVLRRGIPERFR